MESQNGQSDVVVQPDEWRFVFEHHRDQRDAWGSAQRVQHRILMLQNEVEVRYLELGCYFWLVREYGLYEQLGYETFTLYCASPEIHWSRGYIYKMIATAEAFYPEMLRALANPTVFAGNHSEDTDEPHPATIVPTQDLAELGILKASIIAPEVKRNPHRAEELVARGKTLSDLDLTLSMREEKEPTFSQRDEFAFETGNKIIGLGYELQSGKHPSETLLRIRDTAIEAIAYWEAMPHGNAPAGQAADLPD